MEMDYLVVVVVVVVVIIGFSIWGDGRGLDSSACSNMSGSVNFRSIVVIVVVVVETEMVLVVVVEMGDIYEVLLWNW